MAIIDVDISTPDSLHCLTVMIHVKGGRKKVDVLVFCREGCENADFQVSSLICSGEISQHCCLLYTITVNAVFRFPIRSDQFYRCVHSSAVPHDQGS